MIDQAIADYQSGLSAKAVGQKYGIDTQTVLNNLNARGITARAMQPLESSTAPTLEPSSIGAWAIQQGIPVAAREPLPRRIVRRSGKRRPIFGQPRCFSRASVTGAIHAWRQLERPATMVLKPFATSAAETDQLEEGARVTYDSCCRR